MLMSHEAHIHPAQTIILRELLFRPDSTYAVLQKPTGLTSDHFNFHIKRLVELGFVKKLPKGAYSLTAKGKEYANRLDTDQNTIERQPKVAVLLAPVKKEGKTVRYLFQERLKHPYYGYWGFVTGKIRWGETVYQTAARELKEETGLTGNCKFIGIYHEHTFNKKTGEQLEDKIFFVLGITDVAGELVSQFEGGHNEWLTVEEVSAKKVFESFAVELEFAEGKHTFVERTASYSEEDF